MDPERACSVEQFVDMMKRLKDASGLTYRQLEERAERNGRVLPRSTIADVLRRQALPRPQILDSFVHACGAGEHVEVWLQARTRLALADGSAEGVPAVDGRAARVSPSQAGGDGDGSFEAGGAREGPAVEDVGSSDVPSDPGPVPARLRRRHRAVVPTLLASLCAVIMAGIATWLVLPDGPVGTDPSRQEPAGGWYSLRPVRAADLCVTEGRETGGESERPVAVQRPCVRSTPPYTRIRPIGGGRFFVEWAHPVHGWGCLTVLPGGLLEPWDDCRSSRTSQVFTFEPVETTGTRASSTTPAKAYRLRSADGQCVGISGTDPKAATAVARAQPCADTPAQHLLLVPEREPEANALPSATD
ncbi:helix-turn-helix domain-containing protein [Streptomyces sp. NPDC012825]|uniref:helix-turn-helix domain-containing protein n=1 Tax=Streptomyces sp. NPDC012825 TaxID=3364851 RepID=UPI0036BB70FB